MKRHVVRAALTDLEKLGIVERSPNRSASVRDFSPEEVGHIFVTTPCDGRNLVVDDIGAR